MAVEHKHIIIRALVKSPPRPDEIKYMTKWFKDLVKAIGMNLLKGPYVTYLDKEGNRGFTGVSIIETSHIAMHVWDEDDPSLIQLDVYTCSSLNIEQVIAFLKVFQPVSIEYMVLDRKNELFTQAYKKEVNDEF